MGNPNTIWTQLSMPDPPAGSVPFVADDNITIITSVTNFKYDSVQQAVMCKNFLPIATTGCSLGNSSYKFDGVFLTSANNANGETSGASGSFLIPQGTSVKTVTNTKVSGTSKVFLQAVTGGNGGVVSQVSAQTGQFTVTLVNVASTAMSFNYVVIN